LPLARAPARCGASGVAGADLKKENEGFYLSAGPLAALLAGLALTPLRGLTPSSNFTFVFVAITVVVAELGGRTPAILTALASALSLDFFLTRPYLRLTIEDKHDVIAFVGLAACGLLVAAIATRRQHRLERLEGARARRDLLAETIRDWNDAEPAEPQLHRLLARCRETFPLEAAVLREPSGAVRAASEASAARRAVPAEVLAPDTLRRRSAGDGDRDSALPTSGGRIELVRGERSVGSLDVWGTGDGMTPESRRCFADMVRLLALLMTGARTPDVA
jgi:K+-sensing histidine kinase KdpD